MTALDVALTLTICGLLAGLRYQWAEHKQTRADLVRAERGRQARQINVKFVEHVTGALRASKPARTYTAEKIVREIEQ